MCLLDLVLSPQWDRTPLFYAACLQDKGYLYNMLVKAGADESAKDEVMNGVAHCTEIMRHFDFNNRDNGQLKKAVAVTNNM